MGINRVVIFTLFVLCVLLDVHAQVYYNITVRSTDGTALKDVIVYSFPNEERAKVAYRQGKSNDDAGIFDKINCKLIGEAKTDNNGFCTIQCVPAGFVILDGADVPSGRYDFKMFSIRKAPKDPNDEFTLNLALDVIKKYRRSDGGDNSGFLNHGEATEIREVLSTAQAQMEPGGGGVERYGKNKIRVAKDLDIQGELARTDARFVAFPYIVFEEAEDSFSYLPPAVVDGKNYKRGMMRRMSFDASRDKLYEFCFDASVQLRDHGSERILYDQWVNISKGTKYHIPGILWYEDYNGVYHRDSVLFQDGKEKEPMRFLDWSGARNVIPIEREKFVIQGTFESVKDKASYNLEFEQGKSRLDLNDSVTVADRDRMLHWLDGYYNTRDGFIDSIIIRGYSSPEGREGRNRELSHERATTIGALLKERFKGVIIEPKFDNNDNIVPWQRVADIMTEMDDTLARMYATQIREIIADKKSLDAQSSAIQANKLLYNYTNENVLKRVRMVDIQANVVVRKILSRDEVVDRYERDPEFRYNMVPYQYYHMLCYLADEERWDELYDVAKRAYTKYDKEREVWKQYLKPGTTDSLQFVASRIPYPLAGYYYAVASLKKGMVDVNILKPYLDDGKVNRLPELNSFPFIVAQVLMYCQMEEFDGANDLIKKYNLTAYPKLQGLTMFVRCLDGQYNGKENEDVRRYVMSTSLMNKAVIYTALGHYREALTVLYNDSVPQSDAKVEYLKAICHFNLLNANMRRPEVDGYSPDAIYTNPEDVVDGEGATGMNTTAWASPMLNALRLDESNADYLAHDGYFNNAYRQMVLYCWERLKAGVPIERVAEEYRALVARMRKSRAQTN